MDTARWERIQTLFHKAADLSESEQQALLQNACGDDDALLADVVALLKEDVRGGSLLDGGLAQAADRVLTDGVTSLLGSKDLGPYRVKKVLGEGGMGVVYLAEREDLGSLVAIKILRDAWLSPARRERFTSEQRTLAQLNHPSIARLYDADTLSDGTPCFVMEYVEGIPLTEYCKKHNCPVERRLQLFRLVCEAVLYAHQNAVIHRDLKPSNILVKSDGSVRLLDFGIAKQIDTLDSTVDQTRTGLRLMTPAYAAPEQARGDRVGIQADVYSLGVILYELLAGQLPFNLINLTPAEAATIIVDHEPGRPSIVARKKDGRADAGVTAPAISKAAWSELDVLCLKAMRKDPERRYRSVEAFIRDIDHYLRGEPLEARPDTLGYRLAKFAARNRSSVSVAAAVLIIVVGLVVFFTVRLAKARNAAMAEAARTHRIQSFMLNLFEGGDQSVGPAEDLRVVTLVDRGAQEARALDGEPAVQAELYETLGTIYQNLGKFDQAEKLISSSLEQRKALFGEDSPEVAEILVDFALLRDAQAKFDDAERLAQQGLAMAKRHLPSNHPAVAKATSSLGKILEDRGEYDKAIPVLEEAVRLQSGSDAQVADLSASMTELANSHFYAGNYSVSDALNKQILAMDRKLYGERHPHVADDLINLGAIQFEGGHYAEAELYYRQGLGIIQAFYGKDHAETGSAFTMLGRALIPQKKLKEAEVMLGEALGIAERVYGKVHPRVASALNELGRIAQQQGDLKGAESYFSRMADIYREVYKGKHYYIGLALSNLGGAYVEDKQYERAERCFREALQIYGQTLSAGHQNVGIARARLGRALLRQRRFVEAEAESRAAYVILLKQTNPPAAWLNNARTDLAEEYDGLKKPDQAAKFRAELAQSAQNQTSLITKK
jgi:serine/threonine protein kinase/tetratricopeptide (TPR) repeat protein